MQWSVPRALAFEYEPGEQDDGIDNDGDGLVDEGLLAWTANPAQPDEQRVILAHDLCEFLVGEDFNGADDNANGLTDEHGLSFSIAGDILTIRVSVQGLGPTQNLITKSAETSVFLRN